MIDYDLYVFCPHCQGFHDALMRVPRQETFEVLRVTDVYGKNVPAHFYQAISELRCPNTNKPINQTDANLMVLAEVAKWSLRRKKNAA